MKTILPIQICAVITNLFFSVNLAWSKSQYVYDKQTYLHTHFKKSWENFNPLNIQQK